MCTLDVSKSQSLNHVYGHSSKFIQNLEHINLVSLTTLFLFLWGSSSHSSCSFGCCWSRLIRRPVIALHLETIIINKVRTLQGQPQCNSKMVTTKNAVANTFTPGTHARMWSSWFLWVVVGALRIIVLSPLMTSINLAWFGKSGWRLRSPKR